MYSGARAIGSDMLFDEQKSASREDDDLRVIGEKLGEAAEKVCVGPTTR